jgi:hypothetical protein
LTVFCRKWPKVLAPGDLFEVCILPDQPIGDQLWFNLGIPGYSSLQTNEVQQRQEDYERKKKTQE